MTRDPLGPAYQMRNAVAHGYFTVDLDVVWKTVRGDLPEFRLKVQAALRAARGTGKASRALELLDKAAEAGKAD